MVLHPCLSDQQGKRMEYILISLCIHSLIGIMLLIPLPFYILISKFGFKEVGTGWVLD